MRVDGEDGGGGQEYMERWEVARWVAGASLRRREAERKRKIKQGLTRAEGVACRFGSICLTAFPVGAGA